MNLANDAFQKFRKMIVDPGVLEGQSYPFARQNFLERKPVNCGGLPARIADRDVRVLIAERLELLFQKTRCQGRKESIPGDGHSKDNQEPCPKPPESLGRSRSFDSWGSQLDLGGLTPTHAELGSESGCIHGQVRE